MFTSVRIEKFMRIKDSGLIKLGPVTLLVGENGSGKSSILKGIHWAIRCAVLKDGNDKVTLERMNYVPSRDFLYLGHSIKLNSEAASPKIKITLESNGKNLIIDLSSTRNDAGVKASVRGTLSSLINASSRITSYIPGLAGLSEAESLLATPVLHRKAASGEGGSVLRHILLGLAISQQGNENIDKFVELSELNNWVGKVFPKVRFWVKFDRLRDVNIEAKFLTPDMVVAGKKIDQQWRSLEMAGTGFLQVVQIFAYLLHFKPKLLLIDEPDSHLHPGTQERLISAIEEASKIFPETQYIIATHSPNLVKSSSAISEVHWISNGVNKNENEQVIRNRMGWGALDKDLMIITEDGNIEFMDSILNQWPDLKRKILIWPTYGSGSLPNGSAIKRLRASLGIKVIIHRDRDFLSDRDKKALEKKMGYDSCEVNLWMPKGSDIEAAFCDPEHISNVFEISIDEANELISDALLLLDRDQVEIDFNRLYTSATGGINASEVSVPSMRWRDLGEFCSRTVKGKVLLEKILESAKNKFSSSPGKLKGLSKIKNPTISMNEDLKRVIDLEIARK